MIRNKWRQTLPEDLRHPCPLQTAALDIATLPVKVHLGVQPQRCCWAWYLYCIYIVDPLDVYLVREKYIYGACVVGVWLVVAVVVVLLVLCVIFVVPFVLLPVVMLGVAVVHFVD